jgi:hypothetical protein
MIVRRAVVALMCLGALGIVAMAGSCQAAEPAAGGQPWSETFVMQLREKSRTFVLHDGVAYLAIEPADGDDPFFLPGKEVMLAGKFERSDGARAWFFGYDSLVARGPAENWATRLEGDNLFVFGRVESIPGAADELRVAAVVVGESDAQVIARKLEPIPADDHQGRLAVAAWARETGATLGNRDFWQASADTIVTRVVEDAARDAAARKDAALLARAVGWSLDLLADPVVTARIASQPWLFDAGGPEADEIAKRLRALRYDLYNGMWRSRPESLALQFEDRFAALAWHDAEGFYKLGRWVEANAEEMPRARDLTYRCYQAGFRADPNHNGIRRELGMELVASAGGGKATLDGAFRDPSGVAVDGPDGWTRGQPIDGDATWTDPRSETAFITIRVLTDQELAGTFPDTWARLLTPLSTLTGFAAREEVAVPVAEGEGRRLRYSYREGRYTRFAEVVLAWHSTVRAAVVLTASYTEGEQQAAAEALTATLAKVTFPAAVQGATTAPEPAPTPAPPAN